MQQGQHQAQGLQRLFSGLSAARIVSVLATPNVSDCHEFVLVLADALARRDQRVCLVDTRSGNLSASLGCRPLLPWQADRSLEAQIMKAGRHDLLYAPSCAAGDESITAAAQVTRGIDFLLFDGGRVSPTEALIESTTAQTLIFLMSKEDAETAYALIKAMKNLDSPARILLIGEESDRVAYALDHFINASVESFKAEGHLYQISNKKQETSSNTLTIEPNLTWVVSRITKNDQPKVAHGGFGKSAKEV